MSDIILKTELSKYLSINMKDAKTKREIKQLIAHYIDRNNTQLYASSPLHRVMFSDKNDREPLFKIVDLEVDVITELLKRVPAINPKWEIANNPFNILCVMLIREAMLNKDKELMENILLYLTLSFYASLHYKYYRYPPNENIMDYTINNLSNKFLFKQYGVVLKALFHTAIKSHEKYDQELKVGKDVDLVNYLMFLNTRLNNLMKNFTNEYMKNATEKNYLNKEKDNTSEDGYFETDNISITIARITQNGITQFTSSPLNQQYINISSKYCAVSPVTLKQSLESIKQSESKKVGDLIRIILQIYLNDGNNSQDSVASKKFISYSLSIYSKNNTKDKGILELKALLDEFLLNHSNKYSSSEREATRSAYRKALFLYFVFFIQGVQMKK